MMDGHGGVVLGSENSGSIRNVFAENNQMDSPHLQRALRLKTNAGRGGVLENVFMRNCTIGEVSDSILTIDLVYSRVTSGPFIPTVRNVVIENVTGRKAPRVLSIVGIEKSIIENIRVENCTFHGVEGADLLAYSGDVTYKNVTVEPAKKPKSEGN
jgi:unsaturated rhamnogalacturonyl hydrolase